jgi:hypothetical protein
VVETVYARCEFDSHADTCALGKNFIPIAYTGRVCDVSAYNPDQGQKEKDVPIISGATAYTCQKSGQTFILVVNEGLWFGEKLHHSLLNQNQLRYHGVPVWDNPFDPTRPISIEHSELTIPLLISGTNIFLETRTPTQHELDNCPHLHLTSDMEWNPHTVCLAATASTEAERAAVPATLDVGIEPGLLQISSIYSFPEMAMGLAATLASDWASIQAIQVDVPGHRTFVSKQRHSAVTPEELSERWNIGLEQARQTIKVTTQRGVRSAILPLSRRYPEQIGCTISASCADSDSILIL